MAIYVKNKDLYNELVYCRDNSLNYTDDLIDMFTLISTRMSTKFSYAREEDKQDCIQGGIIEAFTYWNRFDPSISSNAFSYITQVIKNGYAKTFRKIYPYSEKGTIRISIDTIYNI